MEETMKTQIIFLLVCSVFFVFYLNAKQNDVDLTNSTGKIYPDGLLEGLDFSVTTIGLGNTQYNADRSSPFALVQYKGVKFLVNIGNGTRAQLEKVGLTKRNSLNVLFITHYHIDYNEEFIPMVH